MHEAGVTAKSFEVKVGVHQVSVLSPLLFIIVMEAFSREFCSGSPREDYYADDPILLTENDCREWKLTTVDPQERST